MRTDVEYKVVTSIDELPTFSPDLPIFCDIETDGLYQNIRLIQYYQPETSPLIWILDVNYFGEHSAFKETGNSLFKFLNRKHEALVTIEQVKELHSKLWLVWWNGTFDQGTMRFTSKKVDDLWYMAKFQLPFCPAYNLDVVTNYLFPHEGYYEGLDKKKMHKEGFKPGPLNEEQLLYSAMDVFVMKAIWDKIHKDIINKTVYRLDMLNQVYAITWQQNGLKVNRQIWEETFKEVTEEAERLTLLLPEGLNVNSWQQVRNLLGSTESDASFLLKKASEGCPYSTNILHKRQKLKQLSFLDNYNHDRVYGHYNPYGTRTGRWSCKGGSEDDMANLQQLPRKLKRVFGFTDDEDFVMVGADLPTAELRLAAAIYVDEAMVYAFKNNIDIHIQTASYDANVTMDQVTDDMRKKAKASNFGLLYGMKAKKFQGYAFDNYGIIYSLEEAGLRVDSWLKRYPGIATKIKEMTNRFYKEPKLTVSTPMGRIVKPDMYTDALNIPIQGAVAEISKLWIHKMFMLAKKPVPIVTMVHDSVTLQCHYSEVDYWKGIVKDASVQAWNDYCKLDMMKVKDIPMDVEVTSGKGYKNAS